MLQTRPPEEERFLQRPRIIIATAPPCRTATSGRNGQGQTQLLPQYGIREFRGEG